MEQPNLTILHKVSISGNDPINFILADNSTSTIGFLASKNVRHPSMYGMWDGPSSVSREGLGWVWSYEHYGVSCAPLFWHIFYTIETDIAHFLRTLSLVDSAVRSCYFTPPWLRLLSRTRIGASLSQVAHPNLDTWATMYRVVFDQAWVNWGLIDQPEVGHCRLDPKMRLNLLKMRAPWHKLGRLRRHLQWRSFWFLG